MKDKREKWHIDVVILISFHIEANGEEGRVHSCRQYTWEIQVKRSRLEKLGWDTESLNHLDKLCSLRARIKMSPFRGIKGLGVEHSKVLIGKNNYNYHDIKTWSCEISWKVPPLLLLTWCVLSYKVEKILSSQLIAKDCCRNWLVNIRTFLKSFLQT